MPGLEELPREGLIALCWDQAATIARLRQTNVALEERVRRLERQASRNSGNSSMPPSSDDLPGRAKGWGRGKQKGAPGNALPWVAVPDE